MIIIEECNSQINNFYDKLKQTHNNLYLCETVKIVDNESTESNKTIINYDMNNKIIQNKIIKMQKIINKIEQMPQNNINLKYYNLYNKENKKKIKLVQIQYRKISNYFNKIRKLKSPPSLEMKISRLNQKRVHTYKKLI